MATVVRSAIGSSNSIGATYLYATPQLWEDGANTVYANNLVSNDVVWKGEMVEQVSVTSTTTLNGSTTDETRYKWLTAASTQDWQTALSTNRLGGAISGAGITGSFSGNMTLSMTENFAVVEGLVLIGTGSSTQVGVENAGTNGVFRNNYVRGRHNTATSLIRPSGANSVFINNFIEYGGTSACRMITVANAPTSSGDAPTLANNTFLFTSTDVSGGANAVRGYVIEMNASAGTRYIRCIGNAFLGAGTLFLTTAGTLNFTSDSGYNLTQLVQGSTDYADKFPTGAGGNKYSANITGTWSDSNNVLVNTTYAAGDMRAYATGPLVGAAVAVSTPQNPVGSGGATQRNGTGNLDGYGNARSPSAPWIGAWEDAYRGSTSAAVLAHLRRLMD